MDPLSMLMAFRSRAKAYGQAERDKVLQQFGLDPLSQAKALQQQQLDYAKQADQQKNATDQAAWEQAAGAWAKMNPGIGASGSYVLSQMGGSADTRARGDALMAAYGQQHAGPTMLQRIQMQQQQDQYDRSYALDVQRTNAAVAASMAAREGANNSDQLAGLKYLSQDYQTNMKAPVEVADATQQIANGLQSGDSLGSLAAVIKLAKILDPTSVVREGEVTTVQGGLGTAAALINEWNRLGGKGMPKESADKFLQTVRGIAGPILQRGMRLGEEYRTAAGKLGVRPDLVTTGVGFPEAYVQRYLQGFPNPEQQTDF